MRITSLTRTRWAALGAAIAITLGAGGFGIANATVNDGDKPVFIPIEPCRMIDTRTTDPLGAQEALVFDLAATNGDCIAFPDATALSLNVTATHQTAPTFLSAVPGELPAGPYNASSNLNPVPGEPPTPNAVNVDLDNSQFSIYNNAGTVDVIVDIVGYYANHTHDDRYYTKSVVDQLIVDATPTIDAYTKAETDGLLAAKADAADTYTMGQVDAAIDDVSRFGSCTAGQVVVGLNDDGAPICDADIDAATLDGRDSTEFFAGSVLSAHIDSDGSVLAGNATDAVHVSTGNYRIEFSGHVLSTCTWHTTAHKPGGYAVPESSAAADSVGIRTYPYGATTVHQTGDRQDLEFHFIAVCPS